MWKTQQNTVRSVECWRSLVPGGMHIAQATKAGSMLNTRPNCCREPQGCAPVCKDARLIWPRCAVRPPISHPSPALVSQNQCMEQCGDRQLNATPGTILLVWYCTAVCSLQQDQARKDVAAWSSASIRRIYIGLWGSRAVSYVNAANACQRLTRPLSRLLVIDQSVLIKNYFLKGSRPEITLDHLGATKSARAVAHSTPARPSCTVECIQTLRPATDSNSVVQMITVSAASFLV